MDPNEETKLTTEKKTEVAKGTITISKQQRIIREERVKRAEGNNSEPVYGINISNMMYIKCEDIFSVSIIFILSDTKNQQQIVILWCYLLMEQPC
jgi:hypothetical protein